MRAITVNEYGAAPALTEMPDPRPGSGQLLLKTEAAGITSALTTRYVADTEALASREVAGVNFRVSMSSGLLERLADAVVNTGIVVPPITRVKLDDVPALNGGAHVDGKTVITF